MPVTFATFLARSVEMPSAGPIVAWSAPAQAVRPHPCARLHFSNSEKVPAQSVSRLREATLRGPADSPSRSSREAPRRQNESARRRVRKSQERPGSGRQGQLARTSEPPRHGALAKKCPPHASDTQRSLGHGLGVLFARVVEETSEYSRITFLLFRDLRTSSPRAPGPFRPRHGTA